MLLVKVILNPPVGAFPDKTTVPVALVPPPTELGLIVRPDKVAGVTVKVAV